MRTHCKNSSLPLEEARAAKRVTAQAYLLIRWRQSLAQA